MSPAHVVEPTYAAIKRRLMSGYWPGGARLESGRIAEMLAVSATPVRDSLYRLTGEGMVDFVHGEGFRAHLLTETELRDLLELHLILLLAVLATTRTWELPAQVRGDYPDRATGFFAAVAARSGNGEIARSIVALGERLYPARRCDVLVFDDAAAELDDLAGQLARKGRRGEPRTALLRYHERRARAAGTHARMLAVEAGGSTD